MQISGEQLYYLVQVLKDSLDIQMGYDWSFKSKRDSRKEFYEKLLKSILTQDKIDVPEVDLAKFKQIDGSG